MTAPHADPVRKAIFTGLWRAYSGKEPASDEWEVALASPWPGEVEAVIQALRDAGYEIVHRECSEAAATEIMRQGHLASTRPERVWEEAVRADVASLSPTKET